MVVYSNFKKKLEEKITEGLSEGLGQKLLTSRLFHRLFKRVFLWQKEFNLNAAEEMTDFALDLTARAYDSKQITGWSTVFFPDEILYAAGMTPFSPEISAGVMAAFGQAEEMLQEAEAEGFAPDTCSFHRCAGGLDLQGYLPEPDFIAASSHLCDGAPQLFNYYSQKHDVPCSVLDVPAIANGEAEDYLAGQIEEMFSVCEKITGSDITQSRLEEVFSAANKARKYWLQASNLRSQHPPVLTSPAALSFVYLHFLGFGSSRTAEIMQTLQQDLKSRIENCNINQEEVGKSRVAGKEVPYLLWLHLRPYFSREVFDFIEGRAKIVGEEMLRLYWPSLDPDRPYRSLARKVLSHPGLGPIENRVDTIMQMIEDYDVDGVIHFSHWGCRQSAGGTYQLQSYLQEAGVPFLDLEGDCVDPGGFSSGQIRTRLESFLEMLEMRYQVI